MKNISDAIALENEIAKIVNDIKLQIVQGVGHEDINSPNYISPNAKIVKFSDLHSMNLSSDYYLQQAQAEAVESEIKKVKTATLLVNKLNDLISTKIANKIKLNEQTLAVLSKYLNSI